MASYDLRTGYEALTSQAYHNPDEDTDDQEFAPLAANVIRVTPDSNRFRWNHVEDLDEFFKRVYIYHQRGGLLCMILQDILQLIQYAFVVIFSTFLIKCIDYDILFDEVHHNGTQFHGKVLLTDAFLGSGECLAKFGPGITICLILAGVFWVFRFVIALHNCCQYYEMSQFYMQALEISRNDLPNMTWHDVQKRLRDVQKEHQMCIHKKELTSLDIYNRILRFKNYEIAMVNKSVLPLKLSVPFIGEYCFLSTSLKYNLEMILFWGPWAPFESNWHLKSDFKNYHKRRELAIALSRQILLIGIANLVLLPVIFLWQILYSFFRYAEIIKRQPSFLGARMWSLYARQYLRHFNELDHEFNSRLSRAYSIAESYMNIFTSPILVIVAKYIAFFAGSILAVLVILTIIDEDVLAVNRIITIMTVLGVTVTICRSCIPDENLVWCPELLMKLIVSHINYVPDHWIGRAHTHTVRAEFANLFQYKAVYLMEELLSPFVTPFILCFKLRHKSLDIVDFFRNFTIDVAGVGDVCSFAQLDVKRHGHPEWSCGDDTELNDMNEHDQAENGKTELSLMHFTVTNPEWQPPNEQKVFVNAIKEQVMESARNEEGGLSETTTDDPMLSSLHSLASIGIGYNSLFASGLLRSERPLFGMRGMRSRLALRGGLRNTEGPVDLSNSSNPLTPTGARSRHLSPVDTYSRRGLYDDSVMEQTSTEMSLQALHLHERHQLRRQMIREGESSRQWRGQIPPSPTGLSSLLPYVSEGMEDEQRQNLSIEQPQEQRHFLNDPENQKL